MRPLALPREPEQARAHGFPFVAVLAPVIGSVLIWALTRSPFALVFALLGPLIAIASVADARLQSRRTARRESARFDSEVASTRMAIERRHAEEREQLLRVVPSATGLTSRATHDPERWRIAATAGVPVRLGLGSLPSWVRFDGQPAVTVDGDDPVQVAIDQLQELASTVDGVPIVVDARLGIGVCGPTALAQAVARGILLQLSDRLSPESGVFSVGAAVRDWTETLPHRVVTSCEQRSAVVSWTCDGETGVIAVASRVEDLPVECRVVVQVIVGRGARVVRCPDDVGLELPVALVVELVSSEQAREIGKFLTVSARILRRECPESQPSVDQGFRSLPLPDAAVPGIGSLACVFARRADGVAGMTVDLVAHGPHAVVGGTTGSGKSELLVSWVLAIARAHAPSFVNFLLVDFKGGASFAALRDLPHVVGIVTDLDERTAHRAMLSLRAELKFRERSLAEKGARSVDDPGVDLPRLVIVVDEFAAMAADYPQLHELFADLAARGRSLGLHLVLCTQRPAGAIRDAVLANATLRISLRVNNRADSVAVLGTVQAAELPGDALGRAFISIGGDRVEPVRVARATDDDVTGVIGQYPPPTVPIRRPWCDDLATSIPLVSLDHDGAGIPFALVDLPEQQRQDTARYDPSQRGSLLVIGAKGSGKTELFSTLAAASGVELLPSAAEPAWDAVENAIGRLRLGVRGPRLLLADDLDALVGRLPEEYQPTFVDRLVELARDGSAVGVQLGLTVRRIPPALQTLASLCDERVILRLPSRQDHLMVGGTAVGYVADAPPGSGEWRGSRIQVARRPLGGDTAQGTSILALSGFDLAGFRAVAIVTTRVAEFARRLKSLRPSPGEVTLLLESVTSRLSAPGALGSLELPGARAPSVIIGDPDAWQAHWALLGAVRGSGGLVVVDHCSVSEFRAISGRRTLPPPIRTSADQCWVLETDGSVRRMLAPAA